MSGVPLTSGWVARAVAGTLASGDPSGVVGDVVIDSRAARAGDLFVALRGPRFDGHDFAAGVLARGASVMVEAGAQPTVLAAAQESGQTALPAAVVVVDDTLAALQRLAHAVRRAVPARVVAITGSAGKTTTKEVVAALLGTRFRVVRNKGNLNNHIGLPLSLLQLRTGPDVAVMELGMNHAGEISALVAIAEPDVRVWTNVGDAHLGFFESPDAIADAKAEILEAADAATVLVCNADDARVMARAARFPGRVLSFGTAADAVVRAADVESRGLAGTRARIVTPAGDRVLTIALPGVGNLSNVLAGVAVAVDFGVPLDVIAPAVEEMRPADRRGAIHRLRDITLVDDSYNSSPAALRGVLDMLARTGGFTRKVAVLGEMLELGAHAVRLHEACGRAAAEAGLNCLFVVGGEPARALAAAAVAAGLPAASVRHLERSEEAADVVAAAVAPGDVVLVKGSRGVRTDLIADRLVAERG